ncbi:hypothetical protein PBY51_006275 [Eleginops maclovinus]|uniref:Uncharacterized protein n=1 Tax=Eleginops maclovinus TaxID=56733 RepID=A0AAN7ZVV0_ELEMC|nr:hypothetical protein PBY51_006275 [Eleginops maclovinus]
MDAILNPHVPVLAVFSDGQNDLMQDHILGSQSLEAPLRSLPSRAHKAYRTMWCPGAFDVPKTPALVHTGVEQIAAMRSSKYHPQRKEGGLPSICKAGGGYPCIE